MSNKMQKHSLLFTRVEFPEGITESVVVSFHTLDPVPDPFRKLQEAVTRWVSETPEGQEAYLQSCQDFNIGDLALYQKSARLARYGILRLRFTTIDTFADYDMHLVAHRDNETYHE
jgi:hypothetical protein